jgi:pilus assembly protein Flp/PilA
LTDILPAEDGRDDRIFLALIMRFLKDENAATAIEYGLIAAGIALAVLPVLTGVGTKLKATFSVVQAALK